MYSLEYYKFKFRKCLLVADKRLRSGLKTHKHIAPSCLLRLLCFLKFSLFLARVPLYIIRCLPILTVLLSSHFSDPSPRPPRSAFAPFAPSVWFVFKRKSFAFKRNFWAICAQTAPQNCHLRFTNRTTNPPQSPSKAEKRRFSQIFWVKVLHGSESRRTFALADGKTGMPVSSERQQKVLWKDSINLFVEKYRRLGNSEDELAQGKSLSIPPLINKIRCVRVQRKTKH